MGSGRWRLVTRLPIALPAAACIGLAVLLAVDRGGSAVPLIDDITILGLSTYATVCAVLAALSAAGRMRTAWAIMAAALGSWAVADLIWLLCDYVLHIEPFPSPADLFYLAFSVLAVPGLLAMAPFDALARRQAKIRITLDGITVALCVFLLAWLLALNTVYETYRDDTLTLALALLYPAADIVILAVSVAVLARVDTRQRATLGLLVVAFAVMAVTDSTFAYGVAEDSYTTGSIIDVGWAVSSAMIGMAALVSRRTPAPRPATLSVPSGTALWAPYLPLLVAGIVVPPLVTTGLERYVAPAIVITVCLRQFFAAWENRQWLKAAAERSLRDPLTGLANGTLFHDRLRHAMMLHARGDRSVMVVSLDLDDFAFVNDNLGHPAADRLLVHAGRRIAACVQPGDTVGRVAGDEFALLLEGDVHDSQRVLQRVVATFDEPFDVDGEPVTIRCSVGVAVAFADEPEVTPETMLKRADIAVRVAKRSHFPRVRFFEDDIEDDFEDDMATIDSDAAQGGDRSTDRVALTGAAKVRLLSELRRAVDQGDLELAYQPKVDLVSGQVVGVEALLRWPHPELGLLYPGTFMPLVREHKLIRPVTDLVIDKVLDDAARWVGTGAPIPVAVNLFAPSLIDARLPATLRAALERRGLPADLLTVEITEDLVINDLERVTAVLGQLRDHGIRVSIDDFGSGYSALSYLRDLLIDEIKLDRSFIAAVTTDPRAAVVVRAIIELTHGLGMTVVAEGIEEAATANWLRDSGCDIGQGFYFGKPVDPADVPSLGRLAVGPS